LYLIHEPGAEFRTILYKGAENHASPHIAIWPDSRRLRIRATVLADESASSSPTTDRSVHITVDTRSSIAFRRWTHIAYVVENGRLLHVLINGVLDVSKTLHSPILFNADPMFVAGDPFHSAGARLSCYIDNLSLYSRALSSSELASIGSIAFPGVDMAHVRLGCRSCTHARARLVCPRESSSAFHLCTHAELHSGVLNVARVMGWSSSIVNDRVWSLESHEAYGRVLSDAEATPPPLPPAATTTSHQNNNATRKITLSEFEDDQRDVLNERTQRRALAVCCRNL